MAESSTRPYADAKLPQKGESQVETTENVEFLRPLQLPEETEYILLDEQKLQDLMKKANEESSQLSGLLATENMLMIEVCTSLARILKKVHASCIIPLESLPLRKEVSKAVLNEEAHLKLFYGTERERSAFLAEWPPEMVMAVLSSVIPELPKVIGSYKMMIAKRVSFFEEIKKNLRSIVKSIINTSEENTSLGGEQRQNAPQKNSRAEEQR